MPLPDGLPLAASTSASPPRFWLMMLIAVAVAAFGVGVWLAPHFQHCEYDLRGQHWCRQ